MALLRVVIFAWSLGMLAPAVTAEEIRLEVRGKVYYYDSLGAFCFPEPGSPIAALVDEVRRVQGSNFTNYLVDCRGGKITNGLNTVISINYVGYNSKKFWSEGASDADVERRFIEHARKSAPTILDRLKDSIDSRIGALESIDGSRIEVMSSFVFSVDPFVLAIATSKNLNGEAIESIVFYTARFLENEMIFFYIVVPLGHPDYSVQEGVEKLVAMAATLRAE